MFKKCIHSNCHFKSTARHRVELASQRPLLFALSFHSTTRHCYVEPVAFVLHVIEA